MSNNSNANRWVPFQCPLCFGVFRLKKGQVGSAGHCPTCQSVIKVGEAGDAVAASPALTQASLRVIEEVEEEPAEALLEKIAVAKTMTDEEIAEHEAERQSRRKRNLRGAAAKKIDWEEEGEQTRDSSLSFFQICGGAMLLVLLLGIALFYVKTRKKGKDSGREMILGDAKSKATLDAILEVDPNQNYKNEDGVDTSIEFINERQRFDLEKTEERVRAFLNSTTVSDRVQYVREPERVRPLMLAFYGGEKIEAEGFESLNKINASHHGDLLTTKVAQKNFVSASVSVQRIGEGEDAIYQVDWESWVGYSDFSPEQMKEQKPSEPFELRAAVSIGTYYNYDFSNDDEWSCYKLVLKGAEDSFLGYVKKDLELDRSFLEDLKQQAKKRYLLKVKYPEGARSKDQLEIVEVIKTGWVSDSGEKEAKKDDE